MRGVAWSGDNGPVTAVDVSTDGGRTWQPADLGADKVAIRLAPVVVLLPPRPRKLLQLMARATDASGNIQPFAQEWNPSGYGWNVVQRVGVNVVENLAGDAAGSMRLAVPQQTTPPDSMKDTCLTCHGEDVIRQQRLTRAQWDREITKMTDWGAPVKPEDRDSILNYLAQQYGPRPR